MHPTVTWSNFALKNSLPTSGGSYTRLTNDQVIQLVQTNWHSAVPGAGEFDLNRKILVPVPSYGFFCQPRIPLQVGMPLQAEAKVRQDGEDPFVEVYILEGHARALGFEEIPAKHVNIVCYSAAALEENDGHRSSDADWEIVTILATLGDEHMLPLTMARNYLALPGGTFGNYSAKEFADAIYFHSCNKGVRVALES